VVGLQHALIERLVHYYHVLVGFRANGDRSHFSTDEIGEAMNVDSSQVRKDMAKIDVAGRPRVGFEVDLVLSTIEKTLGFDCEYPAVIVGSGRLGGALASYRSFAAYGLRLVAAFDVDDRKIGKRIGKVTVQPLSDVGAVVQRDGVRLGVITVPAPSAQEVANLLTEAGVQALWNFAPARISVPEEVFVRDEHIAVGLGELAHHLKMRS
jgi:redox-sensing transcriptional repressor